MECKLDGLWCWRCDAETTHSVRLDADAARLTCEACANSSALPLGDLSPARGAPVTAGRRDLE